MNSLTPRGAGNGSPYATIEGASAPSFGPAHAPAGLSAPPKLRLQVWRSLRMHPKLALAVGGLVAGMLLLAAATQKRAYQAESLVYVEPIVAPRLNDMMAPGYDAVRYESYVQQQILTVTRPDTLIAALHALPPDAWRLPNESEQSAVARLESALQVERVLNSYQIAIRLTSADPEKAAAIVNAVTEAYLQGGRKDELTGMDQREQLLGDERQRIKDELETDRKEQAALGTSLGVANPANEQSNPFDAQTASLRAELAAARQAHDVAAAQLSSMGTDQQSGLSAAAADSMNTDAGLSALKSSVNARRATLESDKAGLTPNNPRYQQDQDEIADLDRTLEAMAVKVRDRAERNIEDKLRAQLESTAQVEARLNGQLAQETAKATGAGPKLQRAAELSADIQRLTQRYGVVDNALRELQLQTGGTGMAHLALAATAPTSPQPSKRRLFLLLALPLGLLAGTSAAVVARARDQRIFLGEDLEEASGLTPMAVLPAAADVPDRVYSEYVLRLAAAVEGAYRTSAARTFVLTPVSPRTHSGDLVQALARKLEDLRLKVLVVRSGSLLVTSAETMEYRAQTAAALAHGVDLKEALRSQQAGESIASSKLDRMKGENDLVLIDAAPVLHSAETEYAARCADATILVVESGVTLSSELQEAAALLSRLRVAGVGAVLEELHLDDADEAFKKAVSVVEQRRLEGVAGFVDDQVALIREEAKTVPEPAEEPVKAAAPELVPAVAALGSVAEMRKAEAVSPTVAGSAPLAFAPLQAPAASVEEQPRTGTQDGAEVRPAARRNLGPKSWAQEIEARRPFRGVPAGRAAGERDEASDRPNRNGPQPVAPVPRRARFVAADAEEVSDPRRGMRPAVVPERVDVEEAVTAFSGAPEADGVKGTSNGAVKRIVEPAAAVDGGSVAQEDPNAVGRLVGEKDRIGAVPSYTRSKIRLAFKEQEVNSKTTWFSKLFRGDPPASFRIVPEDDESEEEAAGQPARAFAQQAEEPPDPELQQLLRRINGREHELRREQVRASAVPASTPAPAPAPFAPEAAPVPVAAAAPGVIAAPYAPVPEPRPAATASMASSAGTQAALLERAPAPQLYPAPGRVPRPLSFQQLTGEAPIERPSGTRPAASAPVAEAAAVPASVSAPVPVYGSTPVSVSVLTPVPAQVHLESEIATWPEKTPPPSEPERAFVHSAPEASESSWYFPREREPNSAIGASPAAPAIAVPLAPATAETAAPAPQASLPGPSSRLEAQLAAQPARVPDPNSDPAPSQRIYRLDPAPAAPAEAAAAEFVDRRKPEPEPGQATESIVQHPRRRATDVPGETGIPGLTRRWALLSQFEPEVIDPVPASRKSHQKTDVALPPAQSLMRPEEG